MSGLFENTQLALKVAACFGIKMKESVIQYLSANSEYSDIRSGLEDVVVEGFMIKVGKSDFKFVHDKVREAAYSLIPNNEKKKYHYKLGMSLYSMSKGVDLDDIIFSIADQINHGMDELSASSAELRLCLSELNESAGTKAAYCSDYVTAHSYFSLSLKLLPTDYWKSHYVQSLRLCFLLAKSAYACGYVEKAQTILQEILGECCCLEDKLPAYSLLVTILNAREEGVHAYTTCEEVLSQLGETIPKLLEPKETANVILSTSKLIQNTTDTDLLEMKEMDENLSIYLKFYSVMATVAFFAKPKMFPFLVCRMVELTMKHGICKYSVMGFVMYAAVLCGKSSTSKDIKFASYIGKAAITCLKKRFQAAVQVPKVYFSYYGYVAFHTEPLQLCAQMLRQGFDAGMSIGESGTAFFNSIHHIKTALIAGENLPTLLDRADYYLDLADQYKNELTKTYLCIFRETISTLIDKGETTSSKNNPKYTITENSIKPANSSEAKQFHRAFQAFWLGHSERCHHFIGRMLEMNSVAGTARLSDVVITFLHGLNCFQMLKKQNTSKLRLIPQDAINALKTFNSNSQWNFRNKVHLLEAELFSFRGKHEEAKASYAAAISSAQCSRFIHEQGLACELAGFHYKKMGDHEGARGLFSQARQCYSEWGSQTKMDSIARELETL